MSYARGPSSNSSQLALQALQQSLAELEAEAARVRQAIAALQGETPQPSEPLTIARAAAYVIASAAQPLHIDNIITQLASYGYVQGDPKAFRASLATTLDRKAVGDRAWFFKAAPATYYLTLAGLTIAENIGRQG